MNVQVPFSREAGGIGANHESWL